MQNKWHELTVKSLKKQLDLKKEGTIIQITLGRDDVESIIELIEEDQNRTK